MRATAHLIAGTAKAPPFARAVLTHDARHLRRKVIGLENGEEVLVDLPQTVTLAQGDRLALEDGRTIAIVAAEEPVYEVTGRGAEHLARLAWHLGNRHLPAQIEKTRILIQPDHVIRDMLIGLGASVRETNSPFAPERGAYHAHGAEAHALLNRHG